MTTLDELYDQYRNLYGTVPGWSDDGCCPICMGVKGQSYSECWGCVQASIGAHAHAREQGLIVPLSIAYKSGSGVLAQWYGALREYKQSAVGYAAHHEKLVGILGMGLHVHRERFEAVLGGPIDRVCVVPSKREPFRSVETLGSQPLYRVVARIALPDGQSLIPTLLHRGRELRHTVDATGFFCVDPSVAGQRVVLVDDSLVTGGSSVSAMQCLVEAGAVSVVILTAARVVVPSFAKDVDATSYLATTKLIHDIDRWPRQPR